MWGRRLLILVHQGSRNELNAEYLGSARIKMRTAKAPAQTGMEEVVRVHHMVRRSEPLWPRIMRRLSERGRRSVGAGLRRRGIELRNQSSGVSTLCDYGEDNTVRSDRRGTYRPTESETLSMRRSSMSGSRESLEVAECVPHPVRLGKACGRTTSVYATRQSDRPIVPRIAPNDGPQPAKPATDRRRCRRKGGLAKGNSLKPSMHRTQGRRERYGEP